ncbi:hypothetical protein BGX38DRAFT_866928 [Terfezia claveryi]|nr:hypothetical protein BGX38DRAFT_866928 [Terfezia claveryi]
MGGEAGASRARQARARQAGQARRASEASKAGKASKASRASEAGKASKASRAGKASKVSEASRRLGRDQSLDGATGTWAKPESNGRRHIQMQVRACRPGHETRRLETLGENFSVAAKIHRLRKSKFKHYFIVWLDYFSVILATRGRQLKVLLLSALSAHSLTNVHHEPNFHIGCSYTR